MRATKSVMSGLGTLAVLLVGTVTAVATEPRFEIDVQPMHLSVFGHDQMVLSIEESAPDGSRSSREGVTMDTDSGFSYRTVFRYTPGAWTWGADFFLFINSLSPTHRSAASTDGQSVAFYAGDGAFAVSDGTQSLYYTSLEDNDLSMWTADLYAGRALTDRDDVKLRLVLGLRAADFDHDYRAATGITDLEGIRIDASSNYGRMTGLRVGLETEFRWGKSQFKAGLGQSFVIGDVELTNLSRRFEGPFGDDPVFVAEASFRLTKDVSIPITELQLGYDHSLTRWLAIGFALNGATWWDVPVPPGMAPSGLGEGYLDENTIVLMGLALDLKIRF